MSDTLTTLNVSREDLLESAIGLLELAQGGLGDLIIALRNLDENSEAASDLLLRIDGDWRGAWVGLRMYLATDECVGSA